MAQPLVLALSVLALAVACNVDPEAAADPREATAPRAAVADCSTRSFGEFPGAFEDPGNLAVGPFLLGGAGIATEASVIEELGGQKFAVLLRAGHTATVEVPASARSAASLGWGPLPQGDVGFADGYEAVRFVACPETLTFWPGFVFAPKPACVPLDVFLDGSGTPRRVEIALGAAC